MIQLHYTVIPDYFTCMLKNNMQTSSMFYIGLRQYISERKDLSYVIKSSFKDIDPNGQIDRIIKALGWFGVRNRIGHAYLMKMQEGAFPTDFEFLLTSEIATLEQRVQKFCVDGYSRFFLLGFYLQAMLIDLRVTKPDESLETYLPMDDLVKLLSMAKARVIKIDWLILILLKLRGFLGQEELEVKLKAGTSWDGLYSALQPAQQEDLIENLVRYGSIIGEEDMLVGDLIQ